MSGEVDARQITKAACGPDGGWVPANGLIYVTPKHCVCWPTVRGYAALAPDKLDKLLKQLEKQMYQHAQNLEFEEAAKVRDRIRHIQESNLGLVDEVG